MSKTDNHHAFVEAQYGVRAADYLTSAIHASGADLDRIEAAARATDRALDLGCGGGHVAYRLAPCVAQVTAIDVTAPMLDTVAAEAARRGLDNVAVRQAPAEALPFEDGAFDLVVSRFSAHHWRDMEAGLREARRVLAPGGRAIFVDSLGVDDPLVDTHLQAFELLRDASHVRNYGAPEWAAALTRAGFAVSAFSRWRLPIEFASWIARTRTPQVAVQAIRAMQAGAPAEVTAALAIEADGGFLLDAAMFEVE
jgi:SAM-dependent methyltransferase